MGNFKYKFESINKIKDILKTKAQKELGELNMKIQNKISKIDQTTSEIKESKHVLLSGNTKASELHYYERHVIFLNTQMNKLKVELASLERLRKKKLDELVEKTKEQKMFELLEEKHYRKYLEEELKKENIMMDEIALQKMSRK